MEVYNDRWPIGLGHHDKQIVPDAALDFDLFRITQALQDLGHGRPVTHDEHPIIPAMLAQALDQAIDVAPRYAGDVEAQLLCHRRRGLNRARGLAGIDRRDTGVLQPRCQDFGLRAAGF